MKLTCDMVQDLLPLYIDEICSEDSRAAVEEHLRTCESCRQRYQRMTVAVEQESAPPKPIEEKQFQKGMKKVRRRWTTSLVAALLIVPLLWMTVNQVRGDGMCFTNLYEIGASARFLSLMEQEKYAEAFDCLDSEATWASLTDYDSNEGIDLESYTPVTIDGTLWYVARPQEFWDETPVTLDWEDALDFWETVYQHGMTSGFFILPQEAYETLEAQGCLAGFWEEEGNWYWDENDILQALVQDKEGNGYYIGNGTNPLWWEDEAEVVEGELYQYSWELPCVPETVWSYMKEQQRKARADFEQRAQPYLDMGYDAWLAASKEQFIARMEAWSEQEGAITRFRLRHAYSSAGGIGTSHIGCWQLEFDLWFEGETASQGGIMLCADIAKGRWGTVDYGGGFSREKDSKVDRFLDWLYDASWYDIDA